MALVSVYAFATPALAIDDQDSSPFIVENQFKVAPDSMSGAFTYTYPLTLPPGRNGVQPSVELNYHSGTTDTASMVGYGWVLRMPSIERINRHGVDELYTRHDFTSSFSGELEDIALSDATHGTYGAKVDEGSFLAYSYAIDETWTVTDKRGTVYTFGGATDARLADPSDTSRVFRWYLTRMEDTNGNTVTYSYTKDGNQVYPDSINYTGHDTSSGIFDVDFSLESRDDVSTSYATGFSVETAYRISDISVSVDGDVVREYGLAYIVGDNGVRSLLDAITETTTTEDGTSSIVRTPTEFTYETSERTWTEVTGFSTPEVISGGGGSLGIYLGSRLDDSLVKVPFQDAPQMMFELLRFPCVAPLGIL